MTLYEYIKLTNKDSEIYVSENWLEKFINILGGN